MGAVNFPMSDIYGGMAGTTEYTVPEASDQNALTDDQKANDTVSTANVPKKGIWLSLLLILILVVVLGGKF